MRLLFLTLFLLPALAFSGVRELIGTYQGDNVQQGIPPPPPPIPTEDDITPSVGPLIAQDSYDWIIDLEFLYWFASVTNLSYAKKCELKALGDSTNPTDATLVHRKNENFNWGWDPGSRIGAGVVTNHDGWDFYANWTYYYNSVDTRAGVPDYPAGDFTSTQFNPQGTKVVSTPWDYLPSRDHYNFVKAQFKLLFNQIDLTLGRKFWISPKLSLHPFFGLRGYWSRMHFSIKAFRPFISGAFPIFQNQINAHSRFKQTAWTVGPLGGLDTAWHFTKNWSLFAKAAIALTYGRYAIDQELDNVQIQFNTGGQTFRNIAYSTTSVLWKLQTFADLGLGIRWETILKEKYRLLFDAGWENHFLFKFNELIRGTCNADEFKDLPSTSGSLTLSGITVGGRLEF